MSTDATFAHHVVRMQAIHNEVRNQRDAMLTVLKKWQLFMQANYEPGDISWGIDTDIVIDRVEKSATGPKS